MSPCYICGSPEIATCKLCGKLVCDAHRDTIRNFSACPECAKRMRKQMSIFYIMIPIILLVILIIFFVIWFW